MAMTIVTSGTIDAPAIGIETALSTTPRDLSTTPCNLLGWNIINSDSQAVYVKFCNVRASSVVVGTTAVVKTLMISANGSVLLENSKLQSKQQYFNAAMSCYCVTGVADNNTTAPSANVRVEISFDY